MSNGTTFAKESSPNESLTESCPKRQFSAISPHSSLKVFHYIVFAILFIACYTMLIKWEVCVVAPPKKKLASKRCENCGKIFHQKRYARGPDGTFKNRKYCSRQCAGESFRVKEPAKLRRRKAVIAAYGGKCVCCGEDHWQFLVLDHIDNDGKEHRKKIGQSQICLWAEQHGYPPVLQLFCQNCHLAKHYYGKCPHQIS